MGVLSSLKPHEVFHYFEEICAIPHGSEHTDAISEYVTAFAKEHGLEYRKDASNNVIIWKGGTAGYEEAPSVMLQGHMDMVAVKDADSPLDLETDGLVLALEDGVISAKGTTLGGDDGIAVAYMMAILAADDIPHPPLEAVFTVDEEIGMLGAAALDCSDLKSRILLNMDSEDEGYLLVSCAGGVTAEVQLPASYEKTWENETAYRLSVHGCAGGHSGTEIDKQGANACKVLGRVLHDMVQACELRITGLTGGKKDNAIPTEAEVILIVREKPETCRMVKEKAADWDEIIRQEYAHTDPEICVELAPIDLPESAMTLYASKCIIQSLALHPNGVRKMSQDINGLVQTSLNLGILRSGQTGVRWEETETEADEHEKWHKGYVSMKSSVRSSVETEKRALLSELTALTRLSGGTLNLTGDYPAWEYRKESPLRETMVRIFKEQYGREPVIQALHAGVECGIFAAKLPGLDCVSFGPDMDDIHTTKESMHVDSVQRTWDYVLAILAALKS